MSKEVVLRLDVYFTFKLILVLCVKKVDLFISD